MERTQGYHPMEHTRATSRHHDLAVLGTEVYPERSVNGARHTFVSELRRRSQSDE
jgi:hypothetical protein